MVRRAREQQLSCLWGAPLQNVGRYFVAQGDSRSINSVGPLLKALSSLLMLAYIAYFSIAESGKPSEAKEWNPCHHALKAVARIMTGFSGHQWFNDSPPADHEVCAESGPPFSARQPIRNVDHPNMQLPAPSPQHPPKGPTGALPRRQQLG